MTAVTGIMLWKGVQAKLTLQNSCMLAYQMLETQHNNNDYVYAER